MRRFGSFGVLLVTVFAVSLSAVRTASAAESGRFVSVTPLTSFSPGVTTTVRVTVQNTGDADDMIVEADAWPSGWTVSPKNFNPNMSSGQTSNFSFSVTPSASAVPGTIVWKFYDDDLGVHPTGSDLLATFNQSVSIPETVNTPGTPSGASSGLVGSSISYSVGSVTNNLGHPVQYRFDWGDGTFSSWSSSTSASKTWSSPGTFSVRVQARCATHTSVVSAQSSARSVTLERPKQATITGASPSTFEGVAKTVTISVRNDGRDDANLIVEHSAPSGWSISPSNRQTGVPFNTTNTSFFTFTVTPPATGNSNGSITWRVYFDDVGTSNTLLNSHSQSVSSVPPTPTLNASLSASPGSGTSPLSTTLTASTSGTATGTLNYSFWWHCTSSTTNVSTASSSCGALPSPSSGSCSENSNGLKCNGISPTSRSASHSYTTGTYTPKVIVERSTAPPAEARSTVTVTAPPTPTVALVTFSTSSSSITQNQSFNISTALRVDAALAEHAGISVSFPSLTAVGGSASGYSSSQGTVTTQTVSSGATMVYLDGSTSPGMVCRNNSCINKNHLLAEADWSNVSANSTRTLNLTVTPSQPGPFVVKVRAWVTTGGYANVWRDPSSGPVDQQNYWVYEETITVNAPTVTASLSASPSGGIAPLTTSLSATAGGTATGTLNYSFWWNCNSSSTSVSTAAASCGALPAPTTGNCLENANGYKCNAVSSTTRSVSHVYPVGSYTPKVIIERGSASPAEARSAVTVSAPPTPTVALTTFSLSSASIQPNQPVTISTALRVNSAAGEHAGITISFPSLTAVGTSGAGYASSQGTVTTHSASTGATQTYIDGATAPVMVCRNNTCVNRNHLTVDADWSNVAKDGVRTFNLTVTPKQAGPLVVRVRAWVTTDGYANAWRDPSAGPVDQQNFWVYEDTVAVVAPTLNATLSASPSSGAAPFATALTASLSGTATGTVNYSLWWHCDSSTSSVSAATSACGALPTPGAGSCLSNSVGYKCNGVSDASKVVQRTYATAGTYTPKVIVERGNASPAEARSTVVVSGATPTPLLTTRSVSTTSAVQNQPLTVSATLQVQSALADHAGISVSFPSFTTVGSTGLGYQSAQGSVATNAVSSGAVQYYLDGSVSPGMVCRTTPCNRTHLLAEADWSGVSAGATRTFNLTVTPKQAGTFIIRIRGWATTGGYANVWRDPSSGPLDQQNTWVYEHVVTVVPAPTLTASLSAQPASGVAPLTTTLTASAGGSATGALTYSLWWHCTSATTSVSTAASACGSLPTPSAGSCSENSNGRKCSGVSDTSRTATHTYTSAGAFSPKLIIERGTAAPAQAQTTVTSQCAVSYTPTSRSVGAAAITGNITVAAPAGCQWQAASSAPWLTITSGTTGVGGGTIAYAVQSNAGAARNATITGSGATFQLAQSGSAKPNLTFSKPSGWPDRIVVSKAPGTSSNDSGLTSSDQLYVDVALTNAGAAQIDVPSVVELQVDGVVRATWTAAPPLKTGFTTRFIDYSLGTLAPGTHVLTVTADPGRAIDEIADDDNTYSRTVTIGGSAPVLTAISPTTTAPGGFTLTLTGSGFDSGAVAQVYNKLTGALVATGTVTSRSATTLVTQQSIVGVAQYLVRVKNGNGTLSDAREIDVRGVPAVPVLTSPGAATEGAVIATLTPVFNWKAGAGATFTLVVKREPFGASDTVYENTALADTSVMIPANRLVDATRYRWTVSARNAAGESAPSQPFYFRTQLVQKGSVTGIVRTTSGTPIEGATVVATKSSSGAAGGTTQTDAAGQYTIGNLDAGAHSVDASKSGYAPARVSVTVLAGSTVARSLAMTPLQSSARIVSLRHQFGTDQHFLPRVPLTLTYTATIDWGGQPPGSVEFRLGGRPRVVPAIGSTALLAIDVSRDLRPCDQVSAAAVGADGARSAEMVAPGRVTPELPAPFSAMPMLPVVLGDRAAYRSGAGVELPLIDFGSITMPEKVPVFGGKQVELGKYTPSFDASVEAGQVEMTAGLSKGVEREPSRFLSRLTDKIQFEATLSAGLGAAFSSATCTWDWHGVVSPAGSVAIQGSYPFWIPPVPPIIPVPIPAFARWAASAELSGTVAFALNPLRFVDGSIDFSAEARIGAGVGIADNIAAELTLGAQLDIGWKPVNVPEAFFGLDAELKAYVYGFTLAKFDWSIARFQLYPPSDVADGLAPALVNQVSEPVLESRAYLDAPTRGAVAWGQPPPPPSGLFAPAVTLESAVFPHSDPDIDRSGGPAVMAFVRDNPSRRTINRTQVMVSTFNGTSWTDPQSIADDGTSDFNPQIVSLEDGSMLAVWENANRVHPDGTGLGDVQKNMDIAAAFYDATTGQWRPQVGLTSNGHLDRSPRVSGPHRSNVLVTWLGNALNDQIGSGAAPTTVWAARWNGTAFLAPQLLATLPYPVWSYDVDHDGTTSRVVLSLDVDGDPATIGDRELYKLEAANGTWSPLLRLTNDTVADDTPLFARSGGELTMAWVRGDEVRAAVDGDVPNAVVISSQEYSSNIADFRLVPSADGALAIAWIAPSAHMADVWVALRDRESRTWGAPRQFTDDAEFESNLAAVFTSLDRLMLVYNRASLPAPGNAAAIATTDLLALDRTLGIDLAIDAGSLAVSVADDSPAINFRATVRNAGELTVRDVLVAFYDGNRAAGATMVASARVDTLAPGATAEVAATWIRPDGRAPADLAAVVDPDDQAGDRDRSNNAALSAMGRADLAVQALPVDELSPSLLLVGARVVNNGTAASPATVVTFRNGTTNGSLIDSIEIGSVLPGRSVDVQFNLDTSSMSPVPSAVAAIVDEAGAINESSERNNSALIAIVCKPEVVASPAYFGPAGGATTLSVSTQSGCQWTAHMTGGWLSNATPSHTTGSGAITLAVAANTTPFARRARIDVGGRSVEIVQGAASVAGELAQLLSPTPDTALQAPSETFAWSPGIGVTEYSLEIGTTSGGSDLFSQRTTGLTAVVTNLPIDGRTLYVKLGSVVSGAWQYTQYTILAGRTVTRRLGLGEPGAAPADGDISSHVSATVAAGAAVRLVSPAAGNPLDSPARFVWTPAAGAQGYRLQIGTSVGAGDLLDRHVDSESTSLVVDGLPRDGRALFVRLSAIVGNTWMSVDYVFETALSQ